MKSIIFKMLKFVSTNVFGLATFLSLVGCVTTEQVANNEPEYKIELNPLNDPKQIQSCILFKLENWKNSVRKISTSFDIGKKSGEIVIFQEGPLVPKETLYVIETNPSSLSLKRNAGVFFDNKNAQNLKAALRSCASEMKSASLQDEALQTDAQAPEKVLHIDNSLVRSDKDRVAEATISINDSRDSINDSREEKANQIATFTDYDLCISLHSQPENRELIKSELSKRPVDCDKLLMITSKYGRYLDSNKTVSIVSTSNPYGTTQYILSNGKILYGDKISLVYEFIDFLPKSVQTLFANNFDVFKVEFDTFDERWIIRPSDHRTPISLIIKATEEQIDSYLQVIYFSEDWLFVENVKLRANQKKFELSPVTKFDVKRDNSGRSIWEWFNLPLTDSVSQIAADVASDRQTTIRFYGKDYYNDVKFNDTQHRYFVNALALFQALKK